MSNSFGDAVTSSHTRRRILQTGAGIALARFGFPLHTDAATHAGRKTAALVPNTAPLYISWVQDQANSQYPLTEDHADDAGFTPVDFTDVMTRVSLAIGSQIPVFARWRSYVDGEVAIAALTVDGVDRIAFGITQALLALTDPDGASVPAVTPGTGGVVVLMTALDAATGSDYGSQLLQQTAGDLGSSVQASDHNGVTINWVAGDKASGRIGLAVAQIGETTIVGETPDDLVAIIDVSADSKNLSRRTNHLRARCPDSGATSGSRDTRTVRR